MKINPGQKENVKNLFRSLILAENLLGISRSGMRARKARLEFFCRTLYSTFFVAWAVYILIVDALAISTNDTIFGNHLSQIIYDYSFAVVFIYAEYTNVFWKKNVHVQLFAVIDAIDEKIDAERRAVINSKTRLHTTIFTIWVVTCNATILVGDYFFVNSTTVVRYIFIFMSATVSDLEILHFVLLLQTVSMRIRTATEHLEKYFECCRGGVNNYKLTFSKKRKNKNIFGRMTFDVGSFELTNFYLKIIELCHLIRRLFNIQVFLSLCVSFIYLLMSIRNVLYKFKRKEFRQAYEEYVTASWSLHFSAAFILTCICGEMVCIEVEKSKLTLTKIKLFVSADEQVHIETIYNVLDESGIEEFKACHLFTIRASLMLSYISLITTYVIVLWQYTSLY